MLVLSRRPGQKIVFPGLGISIEVLRTQGAVTRLGILAPDGVTVLREEILLRDPALIQKLTEGSEPVSEPDADLSPESLRTQQHDLKNKLNQLMLKLQLLQRQVELGRAGDSENQLQSVISELSNLERVTVDTELSDPTKRLRVLIVEDQDNERELLADCLRLAGVQVTTARNGREAFDFLHENDVPDLVLLDMRMPELDGPSLIRLIRDDIRLHDLRVFAVTGSLREEFESSFPVDGWFAKPVRIDSMLEAMREPAASARAASV